MNRGEERRLIFANVANKVPVEEVMAAFKRSRYEVEHDVAFVAKKIKEYRFRRLQPPLACDTAYDIALNRYALLDTLRKLGDAYLSSDLILPKVEAQKIENLAHLREAGRKVRAMR